MTTTPTQGAPRTGRRAPRLLPRLAAATAVVALALPLAACGSASAAPTEAAPPAPPRQQPGGHSLTADDVDTWLDGAIGSALQTTGIPGATVSVVSDGELLTAKGYGLADTGTEGGSARPVDPDDTLFRIGSISKVVSATAIMQLVERGDLDLDADVQQYLDFDLDTPKGPITLRHLLTHTAGFEEVIAGLIGTAGSEVPLREAVSAAPPEQVYEPGTTPAYSNYGATLAGYIAERVSGEPFAELLQQNVFEPAGMSSSSFEQPLPDDLDARLAKGYPDDSQPAYPTEVVNAAPAGAMTSSATDMARFMLAHLGDLPGDAALLGDDALAEMHRPALDADQLGTLAAGQRMDLGFFDDSTPGVPAFGHDGDTQVFHSAMRLFPDHDAGIFVSLNGSGRTPTASLDLRTTVLQGFADRYLRDEADDPSRGGAGAVASDGDASDAEAPDGPAAADLAGTYLSSRSPVTNPGALLALSGQTVVVPRTDGTVAVTPKPLGVTTGVYEKIEPNLWREVGGDALLATRTDSGGDADDATVTAISWGASFTLLRAQPWQTASVVVPVALGSLVVLLASMIVWPATALARAGGRSTRRDPSRPDAAPRRKDRMLLLSRLGQASTLLALVGWAIVAVQAMSFAEVTATTLRVLQVLQVLGVLALVPAALVAWRAVRDRRGWAVVTGRVLVVAALAALATVAFVFRLIAPSVSF